MDTIIFMTVEASEQAQSFIDTLSAFLPFPWNCVVSGVGSAIVAVWGWNKLKKKDAKEPAKKS